MNIKRKIWSLPAVAVLIFAVGIAVNYVLSSSASSLLERVGKVDYPFLDKTGMMITDLKGIQENLKNAVTAGDKNGLGLADEKAAGFRKNATELAAIQEHKEIAEKITHQFDTYYQAANESAAIMLGAKEGDIGKAVENMQPALESLNSTLGSAKELAAKEFESGLSAGRDNIERGLMVSILVAAIVIAALGTASYFIIASITANLKQILERMEDIAGGDADLTKKINITSNDEFGQLALLINKFIGNLHGLISRMATTSKEVRQSSSELVAANSSLSGGGQIQADQAAGIARSMEEISATIADMARNCANAADSASGTYRIAKDGGQVIQGTIDSTHKVSDAVNDATRMVEALGASSLQVGEIVRVIRDIAGQTNLLALNAAIEAARAGEQGRGFAVVADEVRTLAQRTSQATLEINQMIEKIQGEIGATVTCIASGKDAASSGRERAASARVALDNILVSVDGVGGVIRQIATATDSLVQTAQEITGKTDQIADVAQNTLAQTRNATQQSGKLNAAIEQLDSMVGSFKL